MLDFNLCGAHPYLPVRSSTVWLSAPRISGRWAKLALVGSHSSLHWGWSALLSCVCVNGNHTVQQQAQGECWHTYLGQLHPTHSCTTVGAESTDCLSAVRVTCVRVSRVCGGGCQRQLALHILNTHMHDKPTPHLCTTPTRTTPAPHLPGGTMHPTHRPCGSRSQGH